MKAYILFTLGATIALAGCNLFDGSETLRYKVTVVVDTAQGARVGSSVIESTIVPGMQFGDASGYKFRVNGEAVSVDLPNGKTLFALLQPAAIDKGIYQSDLLRSVACNDGAPSTPVPAALCSPDKWRDFARWARDHQLGAAMQISSYPLLVMFKDNRNPRSIFKLNPSEDGTITEENIRIKSIYAKISNDHISHDIVKYLAWIPRTYEAIGNGKFHPDGIPVGDFLGLFTTEKFK